MLAGLIILIVIVVFLFGILSLRKRVTKGCCETGDDDSVTSENIDRNPDDYRYTKKVHVEGMHCDNCVKRVENAYAQKGCYAQVSLKKKEAVVHMKKELPDEMLEAIPVRIGYDAKIEK